MQTKVVFCTQFKMPTLMILDELTKRKISRYSVDKFCLLLLPQIEKKTNVI